MKNYRIIEEVERSFLGAEHTATSSGAKAYATAQAKKHALAGKGAVEALRKPSSHKTQALLRKFEDLYIGAENTFLK